MTSKTDERSSFLEFWFDFASGYAYFAALEIEELAAKHQRAVLWRPFTLGAAFKVTGVRGLSSTPLKRDYAHRDWQRIAEMKGVPFHLPQRHPMVGLAALRSVYWLHAIDSCSAARLAKSLIVSYFQDGLDVDDPNSVAHAAKSLGIDHGLVLAGIADPEVKARARAQGEGAVTRGVFGSPWIFVDDEPFWGWDRLPMVDCWLANKSARLK